MSEQSKRGAHISMTYHGAPVVLDMTDKPIGEIEQLIDGLLVRDGWAVQAPAAAANGNGQKPRADRVAPEYDGSGEAICPVHKKVLKEGKFGLYCSAQANAAKGEAANDKGYCSLKFKD